MAAIACQNCGVTLPPLRSPGRPRKWCSEACRVKAYYRKKLAADPGFKPIGYPKSTVAFPTCTECARTWCSRRNGKFVCSAECSNARKARLYRERYAADPATELERHRLLRANQSEEQRNRNRARSHRRRAIVFGVDAEDFPLGEIFDRDGWICQLCMASIDPALRFPDPWSASVDHEIPLSLGGPHTRANCRASHLHCNSSRGNRVG